MTEENLVTRSPKCISHGVCFCFFIFYFYFFWEVERAFFLFTVF